MALSMYSINDRADREQAHRDYIADPDFPALEAEAATKGFRHATIGEIHDSAESKQGAADLFCWQGGLWRKKD